MLSEQDLLIYYISKRSVMQRALLQKITGTLEKSLFFDHFVIKLAKIYEDLTKRIMERTMLENYRGRPKDTNGRMERAVRVYDLLDSLGIEYFSIDHSITDKLEKCREVDTALDIRICKNLFLCNMTIMCR